MHLYTDTTPLIALATVLPCRGKLLREKISEVLQKSWHLHVHVHVHCIVLIHVHVNAHCFYMSMYVAIL